MSDSNGTAKSGKPRRRRRQEFPLFKHPRGYWAKKVGGRHVYFGRIEDDPDGSQALDLWLDQKDDLIAGREPRARHDDLRLKGLCDHFLTYKTELVASGELTQRTLNGYQETLQTLCELARFRLENAGRLKGESV